MLYFLAERPPVHPPHLDHAQRSSADSDEPQKSNDQLQVEELRKNVDKGKQKVAEQDGGHLSLGGTLWY